MFLGCTHIFIRTSKAMQIKQKVHYYSDVETNCTIYAQREWGKSGMCRRMAMLLGPTGIGSVERAAQQLMGDPGAATGASNV